MDAEFFLQSQKQGVWKNKRTFVVGLISSRILLVLKIYNLTMYIKSIDNAITTKFIVCGIKLSSCRMYVSKSDWFRYQSFLAIFRAGIRFLQASRNKICTKGLGKTLTQAKRSFLRKFSRICFQCLESLSHILDFSESVVRIRTDI